MPPVGIRFLERNMPMYDFKCRACGFEAKDVLLTKRSQHPPYSPKCPQCHKIGSLDRQPAAANFSVRGFSAKNGYSNGGNK